MSANGHRRISPAMAGVVTAAFVLGGILAIVVDRATQEDTGTLRASETVAEAPVETIPAIPEPPLRVVATIIQLPAAYTQTAVNNGPTFTFVEGGRVQIETNGRTSIYAAGAFYYLEQGREATITVLNDAQLSIVRLLPEGVEPSTEVR